MSLDAKQKKNKWNRTECDVFKYCTVFTHLTESLVLLFNSETAGGTEWMLVGYIKHLL